MFKKSHSFRGFTNPVGYFKPTYTGSHLPVLDESPCFPETDTPSFCLWGCRLTTSSLAFPVAPEQGLSGLLVLFQCMFRANNYELDCPNLVAGKTKEQRSHAGQPTQSRLRQGLSLWSGHFSALILIRIANDSVDTVECV